MIVSKFTEMQSGHDPFNNITGVLVMMVGAMTVVVTIIVWMGVVVTIVVWMGVIMCADVSVEFLWCSHKFTLLPFGDYDMMQL